MIPTRSRRRVGAVFELRNRLIVPGLPASANTGLSSARLSQDVLR